MAEKHRFTTEIIARNILRNFFRPPFINGRPQETDFIFGKKGH